MKKFNGCTIDYSSSNWPEVVVSISIEDAKVVGLSADFAGESVEGDFKDNKLWKKCVFEEDYIDGECDIRVLDSEYNTLFSAYIDNGYWKMQEESKITGLSREYNGDDCPGEVTQETENLFLEIFRKAKELNKSSKTEIKQSKKFTVSNFEDYDTWLKQRLENDTKITNEDKLLHKEMYDFTVAEFGNDVAFKFRKETIALSINGKKFCNIFLDNKYGVMLYLLRDEQDDFNFPNIKHSCKNVRNDSRNSEYYNITNIKVMDEEIKQQIQKSFEVRKQNKKLLRANHPQLNEILGFN
jgi:hypothetical protein